MFSNDTYAKLASKDPRVAFTAFNKALIGRAYMGLGGYLGTNGHFPGKWYQLHVNKQTFVDIRRDHPWAGLIAMGSLKGKVENMYSRALNHGMSPEQSRVVALSPILDITPQDWTQMMFSFKRSDMSGLPIADFFFDDSNQDSPQKLIRFLDGNVGAFVPGIFRTAQDFQQAYAQWRGQPTPFGIPRFVADRAPYGQALSQIPFAKTQASLPVRYSPLRDFPEVKPHPALQQLLGQVIHKSTPVELEADRLNLNYSDIYPRTGDPTYDNLVMMHSGPIIESTLEPFINSKGWFNLTEGQKKAWFDSTVRKYQAIGKKWAKSELPPSQMLKENIKTKRKIIREGIRAAIIPQDMENEVRRQEQEDENNQ